MRLFNYQNFQFILSCITIRAIHPDTQPNLLAQTAWPGPKPARPIASNSGWWNSIFRNQIQEVSWWVFALKIKSNRPNRPPPLSRCKSGQILMRFIEISTTDVEISIVALNQFWPETNHCQSKQIDSTRGFRLSVVGQLLCHSNLVSQFWVEHKPNLDQPVNSPNYNNINIPTSLCHRFSKFFSTK